MAIERTIHLADVDLNVAVEGAGPALVLLHGFPHTRRVWDPVIADLAEHRTVIAPDLRGLGASSRPGRYSAVDVAGDVVGLLDALGVEDAAVVGLDLGAPAAALTALMHPTRVRRLAVLEGLVGSLPGAEALLAGGPPWWFGFHSVPGFAERVLDGHEADYVDYFLQIGTLGDGVSDEFHEAALHAYRDRDALAAAFEHYRAMPESAAQIADAAQNRLGMPTLTVGSLLGDAIARQLAPIADDLTSEVWDDASHILPQHQPRRLAEVLDDFLS